MFESHTQGRLPCNNEAVLGEEENLSSNPKGYRWDRLGARSSCVTGVESQMVTWDGDQVLQLLLQVHDVIAELDVIHPGETGHHPTAGYMGRTLYTLTTSPISTKKVWGRELTLVKATQALCGRFSPKRRKTSHC